MLRSSSRAGASLAGVVVTLVAVAGCGERVHVGRNPPSVDNLQAIAAAYVSATMRLDRPPESRDELLPYLQVKDRNPAEVLRSPDDDADYVIYWGVDLVHPVPGQSNLIAHEKHGKNGTRYVLIGRNVEQMNDEAIQKYIAARKG